MDKETLEALKDAIEKWKNIEEGKGVDEGCDNCPLCNYLRDEETDRIDCQYCPVLTSGKGSMFCGNTPYDKWTLHYLQSHREFYYKFQRNARCPQCVQIAQEERKFLESLLPKEVR